MKSKYEILVNILDRLNKEALNEHKTYHAKDENGINQARSLGLIHLFLKSKFGLMTYEERYKFITDGRGDGGVDAYYIDEQQKKIFVIQSKFRSTERNFEEKLITPDELNSIELGSIIKGEEYDISGTKYNGKILQFQRDLENIQDLPRYDYKIIILANIGNIKKVTIERLIGGFEHEIFDFKRIYSEMLFPICSGLYFDPDSIKLEIETSENQRSEFNQFIET